MVNKCLAILAALAAGFGAVLAIFRLRRIEVEEDVEALRAIAQRENTMRKAGVQGEAERIRAEVEAVGDDRAELARLLDEG